MAGAVAGWSGRQHQHQQSRLQHPHQQSEAATHGMRPTCRPRFAAADDPVCRPSRLAPSPSAPSAGLATPGAAVQTRHQTARGD